MISAKAPQFTGLAQRLASTAVALAQAHGEMLLRQRRRDGSRWREARLLWPLYTQGDR
ncbi:MAG: hypothetical protein KDE15_04120 [Erythrobacter sp.]|nr:hypothetical protein [Erythrobacter sp.]